ncbi:hypothetical protein POSPLADRAFT_1134437 [Postia placenta MAD-698-R-SB12]|uniref:Lysophospholipase n=1 Tax=Postia placenta MAD-698-R-SB12 TaxID=670580 RepID=A0A1X6NB21_9APHY|nr:hypothetical protein POSPLADRAFT_1134437 [Postia placenta MAD-698-R-SB12]OSX65636.1 hypothetical protein POSPLADRAFT_1134437 [Postia placenta MAD-698-R-SB12]
MKHLALPLSIALCARSVAGQLAASVGYAPVLAPCPPGVSLLREVGTVDQFLSDEEHAYVAGRRSEVLPDAWGSYLAAVTHSVAGVTSLPEYVADILRGTYGERGYPHFGIATSGGGYRAAIFGAGVLNTLDGRNASSVQAGTGGLLQAATYLAGLSGGSWLVTSLAQANFPTLPELIFAPSAASTDSFGGWLTQYDLLEPGNSSVAVDAYVLELVEEIMGKHVAGFPVTVSDVWARTLSRHFVNGTDANDFWDDALPHGAGLTFSAIAKLDTFANYAQPFPIIVTDSLSPNGNESNVFNETDIVIPLTNPIYEINVFEFGSFDPTLAAFTPTEYLGSPNDSLCATNFDQLCFIEAMSSNEFNTYNTSVTLAASPIAAVLELLTDLIPESGIELDVSLVPNPFYGVAPSTYIDSKETLLQLVDGGEDGEVVPFMPLLVKARNVEVIFAIDAAADTEDNWTAGLSAIATQDRMTFFPGTYAFPPVPPLESTFLAHNLTKRPTFFGCESTAESGEPLVIYLANGGPPLGQPPLTNTSTSQFVYSADEIDGMLSQAFDVATQGIPEGLEKDALWPACLACAVVDRSRRRERIERSGVCESCMERYCWS